VGPASADGRRAAGRALLLYALLTLALTWPLALRLRIMDPGDSAFFAWQMAFEIHALATDPARLPHPNACHPARFVLGLDEPVLGTTLLALPLAPFTRDAVLIFNLVRLFTWVLTGFTAYLLARELRCREPAALLGGALFAFAPIRVDQIAHLSTLGTQWLPLVALLLLRFARTQRWRDALLAGAAFALAAYACGYHGLLGLLVWPLPALVLIGARWRLVPRAAAGALVAFLALVPLRALHDAAFEPLGVARGADEARQYSATLESFLAASSWNRLYGPLTGRFRSEANNLFPGLVPVLLPLAGAVVLVRRRAWPSREALALTALAAMGVLVALGPEIRAGDRLLTPSPVGLVRAALPLFAGVRTYSRAGIYLALALGMLAALAFDRLRLRGRVAAAVAALALAETLVVPIPLARWARVIDSSQPAPPVYAWLAAQPPGTPVAELPMLPDEMLFRRPAWHESIYLVRSTLHWQPLVNCATGVEPPGYVRLRELLRAFPSRASLDALRVSGVRYVVVHGRGFGPNQWDRLHDALSQFGGELREVARFDDDRVFEVTR
jgi:hypothetical protein